MIIVKSGFKKIRFNDKKLQKDTAVKLERIFTEAIHAFMVEMINRVPVQTGMARASIKPLAEWLSRQALGVGPITVPINAKRKETWARQRLAHGPDLGKQEPFLNKQGGNQYLSNLVFEWDTSVPHWTHLEEGSNVNVTSAPWFAISHGWDRFRTVLGIAMKYRMPQIKDYITFDSKTVETQDE
jgi:hypothetical protein